MNLTVKKDFRALSGEITIPSDKSISHRAVIFASLAKGISTIKNFSKGKDPRSTLELCKNLGAEISENDSDLIIKSNGILTNFTNEFDCGNSGTTMRLMAGILAGQKFHSKLIGDESLSKRPMKRIIEPLTLMGAKINSIDNHAPIEIFSSELNSIDYVSKISSAQVKSCVLLAGLFANGITKYTEPFISRNHTEIMLASMGADIKTNNNTISIQKSELSPLEIEIPGDISSAAYFLTAGLIVPDSKIIIKNIGLNPTRCGIIEILNKMGANIEILDTKIICGEKIGDIKVEYSPELKSCEISGEIIPKLIDEIPIIALLATQCKGQTIIKDAQDLRNKESDRIQTTVNELKKLGAEIVETPDGMVINGKTKLMGDIEVNSHKDHRLAMTLYIAGLITEKQIRIKDFEWVNISFPEFIGLIESLKKL